MKDNDILSTIDGMTLVNTPLPSQRFIISSLLPEGLSMLGGAPKIGKSWLVLWICLQIAKGENVWNYQTKQGAVLYLCLEDSFERIQSRLLDITDDAPENLYFATIANNLDDCFVGQIENFLLDHPDTVFIAIDTLQNIRGTPNNGNPYANDYRELSVLKAIAYKHKIAILLVHHLRKQKDEDPMNMLSGTTGLSGVVDTAFILDRKKRTENKATLFCTGRDIESIELLLDFDHNSNRWFLDETPGEEVKLIDEIILSVHDFFLSEDINHFMLRNYPSILHYLQKKKSRLPS